MNEYKEKAKRKGRESMKIKEILELTKTMKIDVIAKEHLSIGEKKARAVLKQVGCTYQAGKRGWIYKGDTPEILERSIYDFCTPTADNKKRASKNNSSRVKIKNVDSNIDNKSKEVNNMKDEIIDLLNGNDTNKRVKKFKGFYLDEDIANLLDGIKHGNKSELVNKIIRQYLIDNDLI